MVRVHYSDHFLKYTSRLPREPQAKLARLTVFLRENPYHPLLHTKPLSGDMAGLYSFRITREFRVLFKFLSPDEIMLLDVGDRKFIYR